MIVCAATGLPRSHLLNSDVLDVYIVVDYVVRLLLLLWLCLLLGRLLLLLVHGGRLEHDWFLSFSLVVEVDLIYEINICLDWLISSESLHVP